LKIIISRKANQEIRRRKMALKVPLASEKIFLALMLKNTTTYTQVDQKLHLYTNNLTPADADVIGSYTESTGSGYAAIALTGTSWVISGTGTPATAAYAQQTFTYTGAEANVYGYYVTDGATTPTLLLFAERFSDGPYSIPAGGGSIKVTPQLQLASS
jgi:hypothetical protein